MKATFGKTIQIIRQAKQLSLQSAATAAGISSPYLSLLEADKRTPSMQVLSGLSRGLGVPVSFLVRRSLAGEDEHILQEESCTERDLNATVDKIRKLEAHLKNLAKTDRNEPVQRSRRA